MTKTLLIASVAALAIAAPALAGRGEHGGGRGKGDEQAAPEQQQQAPRAERQQMRAERQQQAPQQQQQRVERQQQQPRFERQQMRVERQQQPRFERQQMRVERQQQPRFERQQMRVERQQQPRVERQQMRVERQQQPRFERQQMRVERQAQRQQQQMPHFERQQARIDQRAQGRDQRDLMRGDREAMRQQQRVVPANSIMPDRGFVPHNSRAMERVAENQQLRAERQQQRIGAQSFDRPSFAPQRLVTVGERFNPTSFANSYAPLGSGSTYADTPQYYHRYDDGSGYMYQVRRSDNVVSSLLPLLGGAFSVGQPMPYAYRGYNVPSAYSSLYYNSPDSYYSYGGGAIYQVDQRTQLIQSVVQLLSGNSLGIGQQLPSSYGVYNVPDAYRGQYYDTADSWYRYNDGYIYQVDPYSRRIEDMYPAYYGGGYGGYDNGYYSAGSAFPMNYADYNVPYGYQSLYYDTPQYDYRYANGGIYQLDAGSQLIQALVALVSGRNFGIGQQLPASYGVYNVPYAYRDQYADTSDSWYRYNDGNIYQVQPRTRVIQRIVPVSYGGSSYGVGTNYAGASPYSGFGYDGYPVGTALPASYADYNVPYAYRDVYYDTPQYDYRYANGAIYQVDPQTRVIQALAALVGGDQWSIGQTLPVGYGVYNVPDAYRARYADSADTWYRYDNGYVYQVDPRTRTISGMFDVV